MVQFLKCYAEVEMFQLEVKQYLAMYRFPVSDGWSITVDIDSMERGIAGQHHPDKRMIAKECEEWLRGQGVKITAHPVYGRSDFVAHNRDGAIVVVEVEGDSSRQREQAMYSSLGQLVLSMADADPHITYGLAFPDTEQWEKQVRKIPPRIRELLRLSTFLVSREGVREL